MTDHPNQTVQAEKYTFDYQREIVATLSSYPEARESFFFVSAPWQSARNNLAFECYGPAWEKYKDNSEARKYVEESVLHSLTESTSYAIRRKYEGMRYIVIYFPDSLNSKRPVDMAFTFDHEVGHQLVPSGFLANNDVMIGESAADAFACLRCLQRFGRDEGLKILADKHIQRLLHPMSSHVTGDWVHLTAAVLAEIIKDAPDRLFENISPQETLATAEHYAQKFSPSETASKNEWEKLNVVVKAKNAPSKASAVNGEQESAEMFFKSGFSRKIKKKHQSSAAWFWIAILLMLIFIICTARNNPALLAY